MPAGAKFALAAVAGTVVVTGASLAGLPRTLGSKRGMQLLSELASKDDAPAVIELHELKLSYSGGQFVDVQVTPKEFPGEDPPPPVSLDRFRCSTDSGLLDVILGRTFTVDVDASGYGESLQCKVRARMDINWALQRARAVLTEDLNVSLNIDEGQLVSAILERTNPLLADLVTGEGAATGRIGDVKILVGSGSSVSLVPSDPLLAYLPKARLVAGGAITLSKGSTGDKLLNALRTAGFAVPDDLESGNVGVELTPINVKADKGVATIARSDALLGGMVHICTWGEFNLNTNKARMHLGLPSTFLRKLPALSKVKADDCIVIALDYDVIPPKRKGGKAKLKIERFNLAVVAKQVARLSSRRLGSAVGGWVGRLVGNKDEDIQKLPPPVEPIPWLDPVSELR